jgi:hypothetical protein
MECNQLDYNEIDYADIEDGDDNANFLQNRSIYSSASENFDSYNDYDEKNDEEIHFYESDQDEADSNSSDDSYAQINVNLLDNEDLFDNGNEDEHIDNNSCYFTDDDDDKILYNAWNDVVDLTEKIFSKQNKEGKQLYEDSKFTTADFADDISKYLRKYVNIKTGERDLMCILDKFFPKDKYNLPIRTNRKGFIESDLHSYNQEKVGVLTYDICKSNGCMVYAGEHRNKAICPCDTPRYRQCTHPSCQKNTGFDESKCKHRNTMYRIPQKTMSYRPLLTTICRLLCTNGFLVALDYENRNNRYNNLSDVKDSPQCKMHLDKMHNIFANQKFQEDVIEVNILLSEFYDGAQIYKWKTSKFYPFVIGILNLPPSYRGKLGVGMFLSTLFSSLPGSAAENFIFKSCLVAELKNLYDGVRYTLNGKEYFIQARLILHIADTIGLQSLLKVAGANSAVGCPLCENCNGVYRGNLNKVIYPNHRNGLPIDHVLRYKANFPMCCPKDFYTKSDVGREMEFYQINKFSKQICSTKYKSESFSNTTGTKWFHVNYPFQYLKDSIYYRFQDFRDEVKYNRKTNEFYLYNGNLAKLNKNITNGVKGVWYFSSLYYVNIETDICWDAMHVFKNWGDYLLSLLLGKKKQNEDSIKKLKDYLQEGGYKYWIENNRLKFPWLLKKHDQILIDCLLECIVIPKGYKKDFDVKKICSQKSFIKSSGYIKLLTALMPFLLSYTNLPMAYKMFFEMLSEDFSELLSEEFDPNDIDKLFNKITELVSLKEGLFPDSECQLIFHQLIDLKSSIKCFGPLRNTWAMSGERSLNRIKVHCKTHFEQNNLRNYDVYENSRMNYYYNFSLDDIYASKDLNEKSKMDVINQKMIFNDKQICIWNAEKNVLKLDELQLNHLLHAILLYVFKEAEYDIDKAKKESRLFNLYCVYACMKEMKEVKDIKDDETCFVHFMYACLKYVGGHPENDYDHLVHRLLDKDDKYYFAYLKDIDRVINQLRYLKTYRFASIKGIRVKSRGRDYCETKQPNRVAKRYGAEQNYDVFLPSNKLNLLNKCWMNRESTWSKIRDTMNILQMTKIINGKTSQIKETVRYAQNNYFCCLSKVEKEGYLDFTLFANVTSWHVLDNKVYCKDTINNKNLQINLYDIHNVFVPLSNYFSTAVAFCSFGQDNKPYNIQLSKDNFYLENKEFFCQNLQKEADYLYMIDVHPERRNVR